MVVEVLKGCKILRHDDRVTVAEVSPERVREIAKGLFNAGCYYSCGMGVDERPVNMRFAMYHVFNCEAERRHVILKLTTPTNELTLPSITPVIEGASWSEREAMDMLGIIFEGHPEPERLILPEDWPEGVYPLRKDFPYNKKLPPAKPKEGRKKPRPDIIEVPLGPYHPTLHEPEYFELYVKGDKIVDAKYRGFHIHRGMEKLAESRMTLNQVPFLAERICGICGCTHSTAYCQAVEDATNIYVPERARYIRTIMLEVERLHSHLLWFGVACHLLGFDSGFMHLWRAREYIMDIAELITGNRKTYGINLIGGVRRDIPEEKKRKVLELLDLAEKDSREILDNVVKMGELKERMENVGVLPKKKGREIGVVGPVARASGIDTDVRRDHPYAAYGDLDFEVPVYKGEDVLSRFLVRYDETFQSFSMIRQALDNMPEGELINEDYEIPGFKLGLGVTEAPRGEDVHVVITWGENKVYRWHPRASTYNNLPAVPVMLRGNDIADAPIIIASIDPCFSCTDHVSIIDSENGRVLWRGSLEEGIRRVGNGKA
ncbi:NADH-quinone oxidoreductase subunit C [Thermococcus sp. AM4]|uniref:hydrogenase large subunit n=1 Tax=Thermococcus sp. (strain AM4) TaxID=246969 RepID=UPI0001870739|nr:NADH-quinone oxidoreductase subunit C [Thermococcus sp. AM4]EEB72991.1 Subunit Mbh(K+L)(fused) of mbhHM(K+L)NJBCD(E+F)GAH'-encoded membrane-bound energy-converting [Ni,Fe]-hydrogenase (catalytic subunit) [Thermococcus sp. AM4]